MSKLISMTDYVENAWTLVTSVENACEHNSTQLRAIVKYAKFLIQPLTLGMFVPCDDDGNFLKEPKVDTSICCDAVLQNGHWCCSCDRSSEGKYQHAKTVVLFEGFYIHHGELYYPNQVHFETALFGQDWFNIEHLLQNAYQPIKLTDYGAICAGIK